MEWDWLPSALRNKTVHILNRRTQYYCNAACCSWKNLSLYSVLDTHSVEGTNVVLYARCLFLSSVFPKENLMKLSTKKEWNRNCCIIPTTSTKCVKINSNTDSSSNLKNTYFNRLEFIATIYKWLRENLAR